MASQVSRRPATVVALARAMAVLVLGTPALAQEPPRFPAATEIVRIDAVVVDKAGRLVTGLTADDFTVEENGKPRPIASFEPIVVLSAAAPPEPKAPPSVSVSAPRAIEPEEGRALLIYFDDIHVSPPGAEWVRRNLGPFLQKEVRPGDVVTIVAPHGNFWWTARTPWEHARLPAVIARLKGQYTRNPFKDEKSDWLVMQEIEYLPRIQEGAFGEDRFGLLREGQYGMALVRVQRTLNGLERAIASLESFRGRKSIVVFSEGFILSPRAVHREYYDRTVDQCRRANVAIFVSDPRGLRTGHPQAEDPTRFGGGALTGGLLDAETAGSSHIAIATGGRVFFQNDATEAVARVLEESRAYYLIGFQPAEGRPGERKLGVHVRREGLEVRARNRYFWGDPLPRETDDTESVAALRAMSDRTDVPFRVSVAPGRAIGEGPVPTRLQLQLDPVAESRERQLKLLIEARPLAKGDLIHDAADLTVPASDVPQAAERELRLSPGVWQARVVLTDQGTGAVGSALHTFEVPGVATEGSGALRAPTRAPVPTTARRDAGRAPTAAPPLATPTISSTAGEPELPAGWHRAGDHPDDYEVGSDPTGGRNGGACGFIGGRGSRPAGYGTLMQAVAADEYRGRRLRFSAYVKAAGVAGWAGLWMRVDGRSKSPSELPPTLGFDNMQGRPIKGTLDWRRYEIVLDVPAEAHVIGFGIVLSGPGRAWLDGLQFETVGADVARTDTMVLPKQPNLRFED